MRKENIVNELRRRGYVVEMTDVVKNGVKLHGVVIGTETFRPTIYIDQYLNSSETDLDKIVESIINIYEEYKNPQFNANKEDLLRWDWVKPRLQLCIQKRGNEPIVRRNFLDLEQYVRVKISMGNDSAGTFKVMPSHLEKFEVTEDELFNIAFENSASKVIIEDMRQIMLDMGMPEEMLTSNEMNMIVVSNRDKVNGASAICFTEVLEEIANRYKTDLAILPSSIHECILIPVKDDTNFLALDDMVQDVNRNDVAPEEVLSSHAYRYIRDEKRIVF